MLFRKRNPNLFAQSADYICDGFLRRRCSYALLRRFQRHSDDVLQRSRRPVAFSTHKMEATPAGCLAEAQSSWKRSLFQDWLHAEIS